MATATAEVANAAPAASRSKKKLILILGGVIIVLAIVGAGLWIGLRGKAAVPGLGSEGSQSAVSESAAKSRVKKTQPGFLPMENFVVNLADKEFERFAQIGITLELETPEMVEKLKAYTPVIRSNVLLLLTHKTSAELLDRAGKEQLTLEIMREAARSIGTEFQAGAAAHDGKRPTPKGREETPGPIVHVHFSSFIIQ